MSPRAIKQNARANDIGVNEIERRIDAAIDMRFGRKINDGIELVFGAERVHLVGVGNISLKEFIAVAVLLRHALEIRKVARVSQRIDIRDVGRLVMSQNVANKVAAYETTAARHQNAHRSAY
jgi:hypothetical protein